jgi:hypothetical protein
MRGRPGGDHEEGRSGARGLERLEHAQGPDGVWAVVEGEGD